MLSAMTKINKILLAFCGISGLGVTVILLMGFISQTPAQENREALQITSPPDGTRVSPGQTISVTVNTTPGIALSVVNNIPILTILGEGNLASDSALTQQAPFEFSLTIPEGTTPGSYSIFADGLLSTGEGVRSKRINLVVEVA